MVGVSGHIRGQANYARRLQSRRKRNSAIDGRRSLQGATWDPNSAPFVNNPNGQSRPEPRILSTVRRNGLRPSLSSQTDRRASKTIPRCIEVDLIHVGCEKIADDRHAASRGGRCHADRHRSPCRRTGSLKNHTRCWQIDTGLAGEPAEHSRFTQVVWPFELGPHEISRVSRHIYALGKDSIRTEILQ
jgi:hypothetical protein